jgi:hypothetical protein
VLLCEAGDFFYDVFQEPNPSETFAQTLGRAVGCSGGVVDHPGAANHIGPKSPCVEPVMQSFIATPFKRTRAAWRA